MKRNVTLFLILLIWASLSTGQDLKVDSYGNPIVNEAVGLPDWAQNDVDALKKEIIKYYDKIKEGAPSANLPEDYYALGNFIGQAFTRNIDISEEIDLYNSEIVTKNVVESVFGYLHYYENLKYSNSVEEYEPTHYNKKVTDFIELAGGDIAEILAIEAINSDATPSGDYTMTTFALGMTNLAGYTTIWDGSAGTYDNFSSDENIGFSFYFYQGDDPDPNTQVRVSTNGYITFFQQGGGALDGTDSSNDNITSPTDPEGYATPWWDDMIVQNQGSVDRVDYKTEGSVGSRVFTVQWFSLSRDTYDPDDYHYYQVKLYEANDQIEFHYGSWVADAGDNATAGMEDYTAADGDCGPNCINTNATKPPNNYRFVPFLGTPGLWKGTTSTSWHTASNWDDGQVPTSSVDVVIPGGTPYAPTITSAAYCLDINIADQLTLSGSSAKLYVDGDIVWESGSSAIATTNSSNIYVKDDWTFASGANVQLDMGYVYFQGTLSATITVLDADCHFFHVRNQKEGTSLSFSSTSSEPLRINGILYLDGTSEFLCYEPTEPIIHNSRISNNGGSLHLNNGTWEFTGGGTNTFATGDYFNNVTISSGSVSFSDHTEVKGDLRIEGGSFSLGSYRIYIGGDWVNTAGVGAFIEGGSEVVFNGSSHQYCNYDENFHYLAIDKPSGALRISNVNTTVTCDEYNWTSGAIDVLSGTFTVDDLCDDGIEGSWYLNSGGEINITNPVQTVDLLGDIHIYGGTMNVYGGSHDSYWPGDSDASLEMTGGNLKFHDVGIYIRSTGTFTDNLSTGTWIGTTGNLIIDRADFTPAYGVFAMLGTTDTYIRIDNGSLNQLDINKTTSDYGEQTQNPLPEKEKYMVDNGIVPIYINQNIYNNPQNSKSDNLIEKGGSSPKANTLSAYTNLNLNHIVLVGGIFNVNGHEVYLGGEFYNYYGTLKMSSSNDKIDLRNIVWWPGSNDDIVFGKIDVRQDWTFEDGTNCSMSPLSTTTFKSGGADHYIECDDADAEFGIVVIDVDTYIYGGSAQPVRITGNCNINSGNEFDVQGESLIVENDLNINSGALMTLWAASNGGSLICNDIIYIYGNMDVGNGNVSTAETFLASSGELSIDGGSYNESYWTVTQISGVFNLVNNGTFQTQGSIQFNSTANTTISNSLIRLARSFIVDGTDVFQPSATTVEFFGAGSTQEIDMEPTNFFNNILINKDTGYEVSLKQDAEVRNDVTINSGGLKLAYWGSYTLSVGGSWTDNMGTGGLIPVEGTVIFFGSLHSDINTDETFYKLVIDKTNTAYNAVEIASDKTIGVLNDLYIADGCLEMNANSILDVDRDITIASGAGLNAVGDNNLNIFVGRHWSNSNTTYSTTVGFNPGTSSTVTFDGPGGPNSIITNSLQQDFYNLIVDKPSGYISLFAGLQVLGNLTLNGGDVYNQANNLHHVFWGDITVNADDLELHQLDGSTTLKGTGNQTLTSYAYAQMHFYQLIVDKTDTKGGGSKAQTVNVAGDGMSFFNLTVHEGTIHLNGNTQTSESSVTVNNGGKLAIGPGATFYSGNLTVNTGGVLEIIGMNGNEATLNCAGTCYIESGGNIAAEYAIIEDLKGDGINIKPGAIVNTSYPFDHCTFIGGAASATLLTINNSQNLTIDGAVFPENTWGGTYNVAKIQNQGNVNFLNAAGLYAGPTYENDNYNRINWDGFVAGLWTGAVSSDWNNPANWQFSMKPTDSDNATIPSGTPNDPRVYNAGAVCKNLSIASGASLHVDDETLTVNGDLEIYGELKMDNAPGILNITNDIFWKAGSMDNITDGAINIYGNWSFEDGTQAQLSVNNTVNFVGTGYQNIICNDADAAFGNIIVDKTGYSSEIFIGTSTQPVRLAGDMNILDGNVFHVQNADLIVNGTLDIEDGGSMDIFGAGSLTNNSDFSLNGELESGGDVFIHGEFQLENTGELTINNGNFISDASYNGNWQYMRGIFNMSDGLFEIRYNPLKITSTFTGNISGGTIRTGYYFSATEANTFQPSGGIVEITDDYPGGAVYCSNGNYLYALRILGNTSAHTDLTINYSLDVQSQCFNLNGHTVNVGSYAWIYDQLQMTNANDILNIYGSVLWYGTSTASITEGTINVSGNWWFYDGVTADLGTGNLVNFTGSDNSTIYFYDADAKFGNLTVNKPDSPTDNINFAATHPISISGILTIDDGNVNIDDNMTLKTGGVNINSGGKLNVIGSSGNEALISQQGGLYDFNVESGGTIAASHAIFEYMSGNGVFIKTGAVVDAIYDFDNCSFRNGASGGTLLTINNNQNLTIDGAIFPENTWSGSYNVTKTTDQGNVTFTNSSGPFAGPTYENDNYDRIEWSGFTAGLWTGAVSNEWNNPANWEYNLKPGASDGVTIPAGTPNDPWVTTANQDCKDLNVEPGASLTVTGKTLTVHGILDVDDGAVMTLYDGSTAGTLINNAGFVLNGELNVGIGAATIHDEFELAATGELNITTGSFTTDKNTGNTTLRGTFNLIGNGSFITYNYLTISSTSTMNVSDGFIVVRSHILIYGTDIFQPSGGTVEFFGDFDSDIQFANGALSGSYFHNLFINKDSGFKAYISQDTEVKNDLNIISGEFACFGNETDVLNNVNIDGKLVMDNSSDVLNIGNDIFWKPGSSDNVTYGNINIDGNWTFENGTNAQLGMGNLVNFTGNDNSIIYIYDADAEFGSIAVHKPNNPSDNISFVVNYPISIQGILSIDDGIVKINDNMALKTGGINVNSGGKLEVVGSSGNEALVTEYAGYYYFNVENGGSIAARHAIFEYMKGDGVNIKSGAIIDGTNDFDFCTFRNGEAGGSLLTINNNQSLTVEEAVFPDNTWGGSFNVSKTEDQGQISFSGYSGNFSGESYENDPHSRIEWQVAGFEIDLTALLEGPFNGSEMNTTLNSGGHLPLAQPYNQPPWNYTGTEAVAAIPNTDIVDWVLIELRDAPDAASATSATIVARQACFLLKNGSVVGMDGYSIPLFTYSPIHSLFAVLWHRNSIGIMSALPLTESGGIYSCDFTSGAGQAYGGTNAHKEIAPGIWGMIGADGNADGQINNGDKIDVWSVQAGTGGYKSGDFNLDAQVNNGDKNDVWVPNTGLGGQVPQ